MRQLQVRLQRLASLDQIPEGQGNLLKGINKRAGRREGASFILFFSKKNLNGNHICNMANIARKKWFLFEVEII